MKILDASNNLKKILTEYKNKNIKIITAFASGTNGLVDGLLENGNDVELMIGTINSFSSPEFIQDCIDKKSPNLTTYVDFRYESSVHWKVYLIEPNITIIGSANFTKIGVGLARDTMVHIEDDTLYSDYIKKYKLLKAIPGVINSASDDFEKSFEIYSKKHDDTQRWLVKKSSYISLSDWLANEANQTLQLFVWDQEHTAESIKKAKSFLDEDEYAEHYSYEVAGDEPIYNEGDIVLTADEKGNNLKFVRFDRIIKKKNKYFLFVLKGNECHVPFNLHGIKGKLKSLVKDCYEYTRCTIHRDDLEPLVLSDYKRVSSKN
ncbi:phospholipase D family protein [Thalassolituus oleivorans]|uniref:phospholipase D family protein n=1 Tax=Thalassolituus oleivorans TaxID=187493 RepID=UPI0023F2ED4F|nr:phospholipase D family protein [Thalassolituus oleivorans]